MNTESPQQTYRLSKLYQCYKNRCLLHFDESLNTGFEWRSQTYFNFWNVNIYGEFYQQFIDGSFKSIFCTTAG